MLSYIMEMVKSSDDTDHLTISGHCLSTGDQWVNNGWCDNGACSHISWRWRRATPLLEYLGPICDVTRVHAVIYHGDGKESPMCDMTRVHTVIWNVRCDKIMYHRDDEEQ